MSSQPVTNPSAEQPPVDPRRPKGPAAVVRAKPAPGSSKAPPGRPGPPRPPGARPPPAKPKKEKSKSWIDSITSALSCCSSKKSPQKTRRPIIKPMPGKHQQPGAKPGVKAVVKPPPGVKAKLVKSASKESSSKSSVRPRKKQPSLESAKTKKAPRSKAAQQKAASESQSSRKVAAKGPFKEKPKQEASTQSGSTRMVDAALKGRSKETPSKVSQEAQKPDSKEATNSKRSKEVAVNDSPTKTARFWPVEDIPEVKTPNPSAEAPDLEDKVKKNVKKEKKKKMEPATSVPVQSLHIDRFVTGKRHVFRWAYEESFPLEDDTEEEVKKSAPKKPVKKEAKEKPKPQKVEDDDDDEPLEVYTFNIKPRPSAVVKPTSPPMPVPKAEVKKAEPKSEKKCELQLVPKRAHPKPALKKVEKKENKEMPEVPSIPKRQKGEALCCSCCDCAGNQRLMAQNKTK